MTGQALCHHRSPLRVTSKPRSDAITTACGGPSPYLEFGNQRLSPRDFPSVPTLSPISHIFSHHPPRLHTLSSYYHHIPTLSTRLQTLHPRAPLDRTRHLKDYQVNAFLDCDTRTVLTGENDLDGLKESHSLNQTRASVAHKRTCISQ